MPRKLRLNAQGQLQDSTGQKWSPAGITRHLEVGDEFEEDTTEGRKTMKVARKSTNAAGYLVVECQEVQA